ncbi:hypothetical protein DXG01_002179 [Tephrocybe rancida]|nr:hypothetical protein DXG01_002179 [Tephrocybe rancida]
MLISSFVDSPKHIVYDARGEMLECKETLKGMTKSIWAAREVGSEGKLGSRTDVTDSINKLSNAMSFSPPLLLLLGITHGESQLDLLHAAAVTTIALEQCYLSKKTVGVEVFGETMSLANTAKDLQCDLLGLRT